MRGQLCHISYKYFKSLMGAIVHCSQGNTKYLAQWEALRTLHVILFSNFDIAVLLETLCPQWKSFHLKKSKLVYILPSLSTIKTSFTDSIPGLPQSLHYTKLAGGTNKCLGTERYTISSITWKKILSLDFLLFINSLNTYPVGTMLDTVNQRWKKLIMCRDVNDEPIIYFPFRFCVFQWS